MKTFLPLFIAALALLTPALHAAGITWTTSAISGPADVITSGKLIGAMNVGSTAPETVFGVTFAPDSGLTGTPITMGAATVQFSFGDTHNDFLVETDIGGSTQYAAALDSARWRADVSSGTVVLGGLTAGRTYQVQLWMTDSRNCCNTRTRTVDGVATNSAGPQIATGTFTAGGPTQTITIADSSGTVGPQLNLIQLREPTLKIYVTNTADSGPGSLRQALADAAAAPGANTILFGPTFSGEPADTIVLGSEIIVNDPDGVTLDATGTPGGVILDGGEGTNRLFNVAAGSSLTLKNLTLTGGNGSGGDGGAISSASTVVAEDCTFSANTATGVGGAIFSSNGSALTLTRCTVSGNTASFEGGGVRSQTAALTATNCTFTGNTAVIGGALSIADGGPAAALTHLTLAGNTATGTSVGGPGNVGGGALYSFGKNATLTNCLIAGNTSPYGPDVQTFINNPASGGGNLIGNNTGLTWTPLASDQTGTGAAPLAARLASLATNGGPTQTRALLPGSPALDAGVAFASTTDQRGFARIRDGDSVAGALPDIGAYEAQLAPFSIGFNLGDAGVSGGDTLGAADIAGVPAFAQGNWNHLAGENSGLAANTDTRLDATGATLPGLKLWWRGPNTWRIGGAADTADKMLMFGYLDSNATGDGSTATDLFNTVNAQPYVAIAGLPAIVGGYRVLVYSDTDNSVGRISRYWLTSNRAENPAAVGTESTLTGSFFTRDTANFSGTYTRATATTDTGATTPEGNYALFENLTEPGGLIIRGEEGSLPATNQARAPINAVQIVRNEAVVVTTAVDENDPVGTLGTGVSLREAIRDAATGSGIVFDSALDGATIPLGSEIALAKNLTIDASSLAGGLTLNGNAATRIFTVSSGTTVALQNLTLTGGNGAGAISSGNGGAIYNAGRLTLTRCTVLENTADDGGAIYIFDGTLTVTHCTFVNNFADDDGGAIHSNEGILTATHSTFCANRADGANGGGGAINNNQGAAFLTHCTFSANSSADDGGALLNDDGQMTLTTNIIAGNSATNSGADIFRSSGTVTPAGANFIGSNDTVVTEFPSGLLVGTAAIPKDALLAPLGSYGGPTQTMPPLPGSPALDAAPGSTATTDQRGFPSPLDGDGNGGAIADIGAVESTAAANFIVQNANDTGAGSLRQAIADAAFAPGATITFPNGFTGPIVLGSEIVIANSVAIDASSVEGGVTIDGGPGANRIFTVNSGANVVLIALTLTGGNSGGTTASGSGGAIYNNGGIITLNQCTLAGNTSSGDAGGAISNTGTLTLSGCTLANNSAQTWGGAIWNGGPLTMDHCTFFGNTALRSGAIDNNGPMVATHCTFTGNTATEYGGALINDNNPNPATTMTLNNCIVAGNLAPASADILNRAALTFTGTNLVQVLTPEAGTVTGTPTNAAPQLAPLGNYGGPTPTMALLPGSPAREASSGSSATSDQRGFPQVGGTWDIGAYEAGTFNTYDTWIWETLPATATAPQHASTFDFDGEGQTNNAEWLALTSAADPNSRLTVTLGAISGTELNYSFQSVLGRNYTVEYTTDLTAGWQTAPGTITGTGNIINATIGPVTGFTKYFIRIRAALP